MIVHAVDLYAGYPDKAFQQPPAVASAMVAAPTSWPAASPVLAREHRRVLCFVRNPDGTNEWSSVVAVCNGIVVPVGHARELLRDKPQLKPAVFVSYKLSAREVNAREAWAAAHGAAERRQLWLSYLMMGVGLGGMIASLLMVACMLLPVPRLRGRVSGKARQMLGMGREAIPIPHS